MDINVKAITMKVSLVELVVCVGQSHTRIDSVVRTRGLRLENIWRNSLENGMECKERENGVNPEFQKAVW